MKKSLIIASALICASSALVAADHNSAWFVGGEFGGQRLSTKATVDIAGVGSENESDSTTATYESLKFGKYLPYGRVYGAISHQNEKDDFASTTYGLGYDYLFKNQSAITPFVGAFVGYTKAKISGETKADFEANGLNLDAPKGWSYGLGLGAIYSITSSIDLEMGARYLKHNIDDKDTVAPVSVKVEAEHSVQYYLGLSYNF